MRDPDDVTVGVVSRLRSDQSTRRDDHSSSSLVGVDSGLESLSPVFTDDILSEYIVPPAPVIVLDSVDTAEQHFAMNRNRSSFDLNLSNAADIVTSRKADKSDKENRIDYKLMSNGSRKVKKKKRVKKTSQEANSSKVTLEVGDILTLL